MAFALISDFSTNTFPCFRYVLRNAKTQEDVIEIAELFFQVCNRMGVKPDEAAITFMSFQSDIPKTLKLLSIDGEQLNYLEYRKAVLNRVYGEKPADCSKKLKKKYPSVIWPDGKSKMAPRLCHTCMAYVSGHARNGNEQIERQLLRFMLTSEENYKMVFAELDQRKYKGNPIKSCVALPTPLSAKTPVVVSLLPRIWNILTGNISSWAYPKDGDVLTRLETLQEPAVSAILDKDLDPAEKECLEQSLDMGPKKFLEKAYMGTVRPIGSDIVPLIKKEELPALLDELLTSSKKKKSAKKTDDLVPKITLETIYNEILRNGQSEQGEGTQYSSIDENGNVVQLNEKPLDDVVVGQAEKAEKGSSEQVQKGHVSVTEGSLSEQSPLNSNNDEINVELPFGNPEIETDDNVENKSGANVGEVAGKTLTEPQDSVIQQTGADISGQGESSLPMESVESSLPGMLRPRYGGAGVLLYELSDEEFVEYKPISNEVESSRIRRSIMSSGVMPVEVILFYGHMLLAFYDKNSSGFYISSVDELDGNIIALLHSRKVIKICWEPYYLYGLCRSAMIYLREVWSLEGAQGVLEPEEAERIDLLERYIADSRYIKKHLSIGRLADELRIYPYAYFDQENAMEEEGVRKKIERTRLDDAILGASFLRGSVFNDDSCLFDITDEDGLIYAPSIPRNTDIGGWIFTVTVFFDKKDMNVAAFLRSVLRSAEKEGYFSGYGLMLLTVTDKGFVLWSPEGLLPEVEENIFLDITTRASRHQTHVKIAADLRRTGVFGEMSAELPESLLNDNGTYSTPDVSLTFSSTHTVIDDRRKREKPTHETQNTIIQ